MSVTQLDKREHYLDVAGPADWRCDEEIARWLLALALRRDGRADAVVRAAEIVPRAGKPIDPLRDLAPREGVAFAAAMYVAWSSALHWDVKRIAGAFGVLQSWCLDVMSATADGAAADPAFRAGLNDICLTLREAMLERVRV